MNKQDIFRVMKLTTLFLLLGFLQLSANSFSQTVTLKGKNLRIQHVLEAIKEQTGYEILGNHAMLKSSRPIQIEAQDMPLIDFLNLIFKDQPLDYRFVDKTIMLERKAISRLPNPVKAETDKTSESLVLVFVEVRGQVLDSLGKPLRGASIKVKGYQLSTLTDVDGIFTLQNVPEDAILQITYVGYVRQERKVAANVGTIILQAAPAAIESVEVMVNTGYQEIPKERATGSFTVITQEQIQRSTGSNILSRLEGITSGLQFNRSAIAGESDEAPTLRIRGLSTIESNDQPLIVVNNFPFHGDINTINPNDVEQITLLKDAAAASIWGAQAGNGVIVIVTKRGKFNQRTRFDFIGSVTHGEKPDLFYTRHWLPSETVMEIQNQNFNKNLYDVNRLGTALPPYVDLLRKLAENRITQEEFDLQERIFKATDFREEASRYLYRSSLHQQYSLNARGGSENIRYFFSLGHDRIRANVIGNEQDRLNLNLQTTFRLMKDLELGAGIWLTNQNSVDNGSTISSIQEIKRMGNMAYVRLRDEFGNALPIPMDVSVKYLEMPDNSSLLDWNYRPLDELKYANNTGNSKEIRLSTNIRYKFLSRFDLLANYQYLQNFGYTRLHYSLDTYYTRHRINQYTQPDGRNIIPVGGILNHTLSPTTTSHSGRGQINYHQKFGWDHEVIALAGFELRQAIRSALPGVILYNYNNALLTASTNLDFLDTYIVRPNGFSQRLPAPPSISTRLTDRDLSYFGNFAYTYQKLYTLSGSARYDGSNLFGVKTNQKGTPLWSLGGSWNLGEEAFFDIPAISYLRLRGTYGVSGNVNKNVTHYPTMRYTSTDSYTNLIYARLLSPGNPSLRWEKVNSLNMAIDFEAFARRLKGNVDFFIKDGSDLIGNDFMPPSTGLVNYKINYANIRTTGWDFQFNWENIRPKKEGDFAWSNMILMSLVKNKITHFNTKATDLITNYIKNAGSQNSAYRAAPLLGKSRDVVYALPWHGLDDAGMPILYQDGERTVAYQNYYNNLTIEDLVVAGVSVPPFYGSFQNVLSWKGFQLDMLLTWKWNYVFSRTSMMPGEERITIAPGFHVDYFQRWQKSGDEQWTNVPADLAGYSVPIANIYANSQYLMTKGDHIRLQDIRFSYSIPSAIATRIKLNNLDVFVYGRELGILWRGNRFGIDPDMPYANYPNQRTFSFGLNLGF